MVLSGAIKNGSNLSQIVVIEIQLNERVEKRSIEGLIIDRSKCIPIQN